MMETVNVEIHRSKDDGDWRLCSYRNKDDGD